MEVQSEWIIAIATIAMVGVAFASAIWNGLTLNELKTSRKISALPLLEFSVSWDNNNTFLVIQNIGNGIARNIKFKTEFEGYENQKPLETEGKNIASGNKNNWRLNMIPQYFLEHGSKVTMKIHCEFQDVFGEKFVIDKNQKMTEKTTTLN